MKQNQKIKRQKVIGFFQHPKYKILLCTGAVRSGKTSTVILAFINWTMTFENNYFAFCGRTMSSIKRIIIQQNIINSDFCNNWKIQYNRTENYIKIGSNIFYLFEGKDEASYTKIQGLTLRGILFDEVALLKESFVNQGMLRCSYDNSKIVFTCNPENVNNHIYKNYIKDKKDDVYIIKWFLEDNPTLTNTKIEEYKNRYSGVYYQRYILGDWVNAEGLVYPIFANNPNKYIKELDRNLLYDSELKFGIDFGGNKSKHAFSLILSNRRRKIKHVLKSELYEPKDYNILESQFLEFIKKSEIEYKPINKITVDSAEQVLKRSLQKVTKIPIYNSIKNEINERIKFTNLLFSTNRLFLTPECKNLKNALSTAVYDNTKLIDTRLDDGTYDIDTLDAFEYNIEDDIKSFI